MSTIPDPPPPPKRDPSELVPHTAVLLMSGGNSIRVKGTPQEIEDMIKAAPKDCTNYEYDAQGRLSYTFVEPAFLVFETANARRQVRVRSLDIEAISGV